MLSSFLSLSSEFSGTGFTISSIQQFPDVFHSLVFFFFPYSSLHLHHKYPVGASQCIHCDILKIETKMRECQGTCHGISLFIVLMLWNQKRAARLHGCQLPALRKHSFRINISLWISVLLNEEELILFLLLWLSMNFDYTRNPVLDKLVVFRSISSASTLSSFSCYSTFSYRGEISGASI